MVLLDPVEKANVEIVAGHFEIHYDDIHGVPPSECRLLPRCFGPSSHQNRARQNFLFELQDGLLVVDQQDPAAGCSMHARRLLGARKRDSANERQVDRQTTLPAAAIPDLNFAAVLLHDSVADAEAKARSLAHRLRGVEGIENRLRILHAGPLSVNSTRSWFPIASGANPDFARTGLFVHRVHRVVQNVQEDLLELVEIAAGEGRLRIELAMDAMLFSFKSYSRSVSVSSRI